MTEMQTIFTRARAAAGVLATLSDAQKNEALAAMATALQTQAARILAANAADVQEYGAALGPVMADRLLLTPDRIRAMADGIRAVLALPDPVGRILAEQTRPNGLCIRRVAVPLGVIGIIYESRPNVTADAAALCLKSGNVCILRGGKEAYRTASTITAVLQEALSACGLPRELVQMPTDTSRQSATAMMEAVGYIDALIPRGGAGLIRACLQQARVPCIQTGTGICHIYVDRDVSLPMALDIVENAKASRPSVCNAAEVCLVHRAIAPAFLPLLQSRLGEERVARGLTPVALRLDEAAAAIIPGTPAGPDDFDTEFLSYTLAIRVVEDLGAALAHIAQHSTHHSEAIVTEDEAAATRFLREVDSAAVYHNASTRFTDGGEFGLGCEIGISTQKLHARGPMGLQELTTYKYCISGNGQIR